MTRLKSWWSFLRSIRLEFRYQDRIDVEVFWRK